MEDHEKSESGAPVYRYEKVTPKDFTAPSGQSDMEAISDHIEKHVGTIEGVFHELVSDLIHVDVHCVKPTIEMPFYTLITSGMSDLPMNVQQEFSTYRHAELCILLPKDWFPENSTIESMHEVFKDENKYWPVRWLKILSRFPHQYNTWLANGHTIPNGENAEPLATNTKMGCLMLISSISLSQEFYELKINEEKTIHFYCLFPLYKEEMDLKLKKGMDALIDKFEEFNLSDILDLNRPNTCKKKGLFGLG